MTEIEIAQGVFVSFNSWHVRLRVTHDHREAKIFLDPAAAEALAQFLAMVTALQEKGAAR